MLSYPGLEPVDYLLIGHISRDLTPDGPKMGGTVAYAARTARAFGLKVGIVTSWGEELDPEPLEGISVINHPSEQSTTFENHYTSDGRKQIIHYQAESLDFYHIPEIWRTTPMVHIAPVAQEINPMIVRNFPDSQVLLTPQGWMRTWDKNKQIIYNDWPEARHILRQADAVVISHEDVQSDQGMINAMAEAAPILVVTQGEEGATLYHEGNARQVTAPSVEQVDATGAGDIFASVFFIQINDRQDPVTAMRVANMVAAHSTRYSGMESTPTQDRLYNLITEVQ